MHGWFVGDDSRRLPCQSMLAAEVAADAPEEGFYRADEDEEFFAAGKKRQSDSGEEEEVVWRCEACNKTFKVCGVGRCALLFVLLGMFGCPLCVPQSEKQLHNHEKSKKHLEALARLREQFLDEDAEDEAVPMPPSDDETTADGVKELGFNEVYCSDEERTAEAIESPQVEPPVDNQQSSSDSEDDVTTSAPSAPTEPKLTAKQKREARRAKKAVKAEKAAASAKVEDDDGVVACAVCHESFSSRNKRGWTSRY
jgi:hypothetical protein